MIYVTIIVSIAIIVAPFILWWLYTYGNNDIICHFSNVKFTLEPLDDEKLQLQDEENETNTHP